MNGQALACFSREPDEELESRTKGIMSIARGHDRKEEEGWSQGIQHDDVSILSHTR